jgi:Zn-dependent protease
MDSTTSGRRSLPKILSGLILLLGVVALKAKAFLLLFFEKIRVLFVNPFEGFGAIAKGLRAGFMVFIPFIGGAVSIKDQPHSVYDDAQIGLAGPAAGTFASLVCLQIYKWIDDPLWLMIAFLGFSLNLINLLPIGMLDGGRISAAITKWMWVFGGAAIVYKVVQQPNPLIILIAVLAAFQVYASLNREKTDPHYYDITGAQRAAIATLYFALVIFLGHQTWMAYGRLELLRQ